MKYNKLNIEIDKKYKMPVFDYTDANNDLSQSSNTATPKNKKEKRKGAGNTNLKNTPHLRGSASLEDMAASISPQTLGHANGAKALPSLSSVLPSIHKKFVDQVEVARKKLKNSRNASSSKAKSINATRASGRQSNNSSLLNAKISYRGSAVSPDDVIIKIISSFGSYFKVWQRKVLLELSTLSGKILPHSVFSAVPGLFSFSSAKQYRLGVLKLIDLTERKLGKSVLTFDEKSKLISGHIGFVVYTQIALNRIWSMS